MIETEIQKLTAAVTQLTVTADALLETLRHQSGKGTLRKFAEDLAAASGTVVTPVASIEMQPVSEDSIEMQPVAEEPASKPKRVKAAKVESPAPAKVEEAPAAPAEESFTVQDLRAEAQKALENGKSAQIVALNKEYGVKRISEVTPDLYAAIIIKLRAINGQT